MAVYRFGQFTYDSRNKAFMRGSDPLRATPKSLHVLEVLLAANGNVVTLEEITGTVWAGIHIDRATVHQNVASLRKLLDDDSKDPAFIMTVPRVGYRFIHPVEAAEADAPVRRSTAIRYGLAIVAVLSIVIVASAMFSGRPGASDQSPARIQYDLGRQYWNERLGAPQAEAAEQAFRNAIRLDPKFALAHVGLADVMMFADGRADESEKEAQKALSIDPKLGEAYATLGFVRMFHRQDWAGAEQSFRRCLELSPDYASGHQWYGDLMMVRNRLPEALAEIGRAAALDSLSVPIASDLAAVSYFQQHYPNAIDQFVKVLVRAPSFIFAQRYLVRSYLLSGQIPAAIQAASEMSDVYEPTRPDRQFLSRTSPGSPQFWESLCRQIHPYEQAICWAMAGEREKSLSQLERAVQSRSPLLMYVAVEPAFRPFHREERFRAVLRSWKLDDVVPTN